MNRPKKIIVFIIALIVLIAGCDKNPINNDPSVYQSIASGSGIIGTKGGEVFIGTEGLPISQAICAIPAGTLPAPAIVSISDASARFSIPGFPGAIVISVQPDTAVLNGLVTIGMPYGHLDASQTDQIKIYSVNPTNQGLTELTNQEFDLTQKIIYGKAGQLGYFTVLPLNNYVVTTGSFQDPRDSETYPWIRLNDQTWMAENLRYDMAGSWCYNESSADCERYGRLYNWTAANDACPSGWHLPTDEEWKALEMLLQMSQSDVDAENWRYSGEAGKKLKSASGWFNNGNGTDAIHFQALPGGFRDGDGSYQYVLQSARFWTSTLSDTGNLAWIRFLDYREPAVYRSLRGWSRGYSVRCIQGTLTSLPSVTTSSVTAITNFSAQSGGVVILSGGSSVIGRGVCWNKSGNPTRNDSNTLDGQGLGSFSSTLSELDPNTKYYVRAYAVNSSGTAYGDELTFTTGNTVTGETGTVTDTRDNQEYTTVKIGNDWWISENLAYPTNKGSWCYNQLPANCITYGRLYDWETARDACMTGWHLATEGEWQALESSLGMTAGELDLPNWRVSGSVGEKLKSTSGWNNSGNGTNDSGFNALPGGIRDGDGTYNYAGSSARFWTGTLTTGTDPWVRYLDDKEKGVYRSARGIDRAFSVRCVKGEVSSLPIVATASVTQITSTTAVCGGSVVSAGGSPVTEKGICWNTTGNPLRNESKAEGGSGTSFTCNMTNLVAKTTYYVRAYAVNSSGAGYGDELSFTTTEMVVITGTFSDPRDLRTYNTVKINDQWWMAENLKFVPASGSWCYSELASNCTLYGRLYNWTAASKACPAGWHLPSDAEWISLEVAFGLPQSSGLTEDWRSTGEVGHKMKSTAGWSANGNGSNDSKFSALPGGFRDGDGAFYYIRESARFWTASKNTSGDPWVRYLQYDQKGVYRKARGTDRGMAVRCVKD